ncbi:hypothetical protein [Rhizobium sp. MHM7A]|uniref:hypothetical protein n=1 Tax=Rhizobium sp. MHM7A TaxID=2583233 RepID=UPI001106E9DB|nr:hypothetical protein [Rhizobium sp. MHM7A]TLX16428.1 hypothetical protein FFR93_03585 [Rhizobium sp. MHM7A]
MTLFVRDAAYETNSSSTHAVVVAEGDINDLSFSQQALRRGVITINPDRSYGRGWKRHRTPEGKLGYLLTVAAGGYVAAPRGKDVLPSIMDKPKVQQIVKAVRKLTKCDIELIFNPGPDIEPYSSDYLFAEVRQGFDLDINDQDLLKRLLFSSKSYIETGDDEQSPPLRILTDIGDGQGDGKEYYDPTLFEAVDRPARWFKLQFMPDDVVNYVDDEGYEHAPTIATYLASNLFGEGKFFGVVTECELDIKEYISWDYEKRRAADPDFENTRASGRKWFAGNELHWLLNVARDGFGNTGDRRMYIAPELDIKVTVTGTSSKANMSIADVDRFEVKFLTDDSSLEVIRAEMINAYSHWHNVD